MTLYQEIPKASILSLLQRRFSARELELSKPEINELILRCETLETLFAEVGKLIKRKTRQPKAVH